MRTLGTNARIGEIQIVSGVMTKAWIKRWTRAEVLDGRGLRLHEKLALSAKLSDQTVVCGSISWHWMVADLVRVHRTWQRDQASVVHCKGLGGLRR